MPSKSVFIPRKTRIKKGITVANLMGHSNTKGDVGIEIEVEGKHLPMSDTTPKSWRYTEDHSLRPKPECAEYVLRAPVPFDKVPGVLRELWDVFHEKKTKINDSNRTSVHVHLNCQDFFLNRLTSFCALYFIVEEVITEWCGDIRVGNLFCLRAKDAPAIVTYLKRFIQDDGQYPIQEFLHYSALNTNALKKYGSLELRTLRGAADPTVIADWVEILERLYRLSEDYPDPREICSSLSSIGPLAFFDFILGPKTTTVRQGIKMTDQEVANSVYEGVRIAQDLCFCRDWDLYKPVKLKADPFGRSTSKIAHKIMNAPVGEMMQMGFSEPSGLLSGVSWQTAAPQVTFPVGSIVTGEMLNHPSLAYAELDSLDNNQYQITGYFPPEPEDDYEED